MEEQPIKISYALTFAELSEGLPLTQAKPVPMWRRILGMGGWLFFLGILLLWWFSSSLQPNPVMNARPIVPRADTDDVWLVLLPTLIPVSVIALLFLSALLKAVITGENSTPAAIARRNLIISRVNLILVMLIMFVGVRLLMNPQWAWAWTPSRPMIVIVAVGPWAILCILVLGLGPLSKWMKMRALWNTTPVVRRAKGMEIDREGIVVVDAKFSSRYRWNFVARYSETASLLRLHLEDQRILMIPKRAVHPDQIIPLRALIHGNVEQGKFIINETGFQVIAPQPVISVGDQ